MNSKKDYERAVAMIKRYYDNAPQVGEDHDGEPIVDCKRAIAVEEAFVQFFITDNPAFNERLFRDACHGKKATRHRMSKAAQAADTDQSDREYIAQRQARAKKV